MESERGWRNRGEQELEPAQGRAMLGMEQAEGAHAVEALRRNVLQEATQELLGGQRHGLLPGVATVAIAESDGGIVVGEQGVLREGSAMHIAAEVVEHLLAALHRGLGEDDGRCRGPGG